MATKKAGGSSRNVRDSEGRRLAVKRYGGNPDEALAVFMEDVSGQMETQQTTNVPPSQPTETAGLMTSPQNMETV